MTVLNLQEAFSHLDDELIDNYLTCRTRNRARLARRQVMRKRVLTCAACFMLVAAVTLAVAYHIRYPAIPLENAVGNVSARYVPGWMVEGKNFSSKKDYTDYELFNRSDCVFSGTIEKIDHVKIDFDGQIIYRSIITITTDHFYKGDYLSKIRIMTAPIGQKDVTSNITLLRLTEGDYGIFITELIAPNDSLLFNNCIFSPSSLAEVKLFDDYCFAFIHDNVNNQVVCYDTIHNHPEKAFSSIDEYTWDNVINYVESMT